MNRRYDFVTKGSAQDEAQRRDEQFYVLIGEHERRADLEDVLALPCQPDEDALLAQPLGDPRGKLSARELDAGEEAASTHFDDLRLAEAADGLTQALADRRRPLR